MATNSVVGIVNADGTITSITGNWDGGLTHVGTVLFTHYQSPAKIAALMALGNFSSLGSALDPINPQTHTMRTREDDVTTFYTRDAKEPGNDAVQYASRAEFIDSIYVTYTYLYDGGHWLVSINGDWSILAYTLDSNTAQYD